MTNTNDRLTLWQLIRDVKAEHAVIDPRKLAYHVAAATPSDRVTDFYEQALIGEVRAVLRAERSDAIARRDDADFDPQTERSDASPRDGEVGSEAQSSKPAESNYSPRQQRCRDWWQRFLETTWSTGDGWKRIRDCRLTDVEYLIVDRRRLIDRTEHVVQRLVVIRQLMQEHGAATVGDLSRADVEGELL